MFKKISKDSKRYYNDLYFVARDEQIALEYAKLYALNPKGIVSFEDFYKMYKDCRHKIIEDNPLVYKTR